MTKKRAPLRYDAGGVMMPFSFEIANCAIDEFACDY